MAQAGVRTGGTLVHLQGLVHQLGRGREVPPLRLQFPVQVERPEMPGIQHEGAPVEGLGRVEAALLVQPQAFLDQGVRALFPAGVGLSGSVHVSLP